MLNNLSPRYPEHKEQSLVFVSSYSLVRHEANLIDGKNDFIDVN